MNRKAKQLTERERKFVAVPVPDDVPSYNEQKKALRKRLNRKPQPGSADP